MKKTPFIWLGAGRAKKRGVARRGRLLDQVAHAGLPVPDGAILLDELFRIYLQEGVVEQVGDKVVVPDPIWLLEVLYRDVGFPRMRETAAIGVILPDGVEGRQSSETACGVDLENADEVSAALSKAWSAAIEMGDCRRDVLVLKQVQAQRRGWALSPGDGDEDQITISSGEDVGEFSLPRLNRWQRPSAELPPYARRLQMLLRGVRRTLGEGDRDINWADDGEVCWIRLFN